MTLREHLTSVYQQTGVLPPELDEPEIPTSLAYLWQWFQELSFSRSSHGYGHNPLSYGDMDAWARLTGRRLDPWEVQALKDVDVVFLSHATKHVGE